MLKLNGIELQEYTLDGLADFIGHLPDSSARDLLLHASAAHAQLKQAQRALIIARIAADNARDEFARSMQAVSDAVQGQWTADQIEAAASAAFPARRRQGRVPQ